MDELNLKLFSCMYVWCNVFMHISDVLLLPFYHVNVMRVTLFDWPFPFSLNDFSVIKSIDNSHRNNVFSVDSK